MRPLSRITTNEACALAGIGLNSPYDAINSGELVTRKRGKHTLILLAELEARQLALPKLESRKVVGKR